jgi:hypothetical protein
MTTRIQAANTLQGVLSAGKIFYAPTGDNISPIVIKNAASNTIFSVTDSASGNGVLSVAKSDGTLISQIHSSGFTYLCRDGTQSHSVCVGGITPDSLAILDVQSTTLGFKVPTMTTAQKNGIGNTPGLIIFDTNLAKLCVNDGTAWRTITST